MIRFVDMRKADIAGVRFGFWDTVTDSMLVVDGEQGWETTEDLATCTAAPGLLDRLFGLCPNWTASVTDSNLLTFAELREANIARLPQFKNKHGKPAHSEPDGSDWSIPVWLMAVTGELGELANLRKKVLRGDLTHEQAQQETADELADITTYLDILAFRLGVDLGAAVASKFNRVSERVQCAVRLSEESNDD